MRDSLRLGRIAGFPVAINWSVLVIMLLLSWGLADGVLPQAAPGHTTLTYWVAGVAGAILLIASLLAHELAHAVLARRSGVEVDGLTLWMFGGVATLRGEAKSPRDDFRIAAVGPATSLVLAALFGVVGVLLALGGLSDLLVTVVMWLATINFVLAVFNLIPGAPLDGGRILRAWLWQRSGNRVRAATTAATVGQVVAYGLVGLGLLAFLLGDTLQGLWTVLIGWFLLAAARAEQVATVAQDYLRGVEVREVMSAPVEVGSADATVAEFVESNVLRGRHSAYPVVGSTGAVEGLVTLEELRGVPAAERGLVRVREVCLPLGAVATTGPGEPLTDVLERLTRESGRRALVFDHGRLVGILSSTDVTRALERRTLFTPAGR